MSVESRVLPNRKQGLGRKLQVLIADEEASSREYLRHLVGTEPATEVVAECATGLEALEAINRDAPHLVFLDVKLPELDGFGVVQALNRECLPAIVFVTADDQFALRAFEIRAVDYVLKPYDRQRFQVAFRRAVDWLQAGSAANSRPIGSQASGFKLGERITIKSRGRITIVKTTEIDWICAADNYVELHAGKATHLLRLPIGSAADQLPPERFVRISRSRVVNCDRIKEIQARSHGDYYVVLEDGTRLAGTRNYRHNLRALRAV